MIKHFADGRAQLWTKDGKRPLGPKESAQKAHAREAMIQAKVKAREKRKA